MLRLANTALKLRFISPVKLSRWLGSTLRGGFGRHLRKIICLHPMRECDHCTIAEQCLFYLTYQKSYSKRGYAPPPRPLVLVPPFLPKPLEGSGAELEVRLLMFGDYSKHFPLVLIALQQFGSSGLGDRRHLGQNRFEVAEARCEFSGKIVFDGNLVHPSNLKIMDIRNLARINGKEFRVRFKTPIDLPEGFPPPPEHLLDLIRHRLILLVNEYGTGEKVPDFSCKGSLIKSEGERHRLVGYGREGRREFWNCWTGFADYRFEKLDKTAQWLLGVGRVLGAGAKSSFGLGFMDIQPLG
jgi:hypothetical protein